MTAPVALLNHRGNPEPSPEIQRRLQAVHPRLELRFIQGIATHWAICLRWEDNDHRWQHIQSQEVNPNRSIDIVGYLPMDCSLDEAPAHLAKSLRQFPKEEVRRIADYVVEFNEHEALRPAVEAALIEVLDNPDPTGTAKRRPRKKS